MTYRGAPIGRSSQSEQLANDPRARRNGQIQTMPELDVGTGLEVNNEGRVSVQPGAFVATPAVNISSHKADLDPGYLSAQQSTSTIDITGSTADSLTNIKNAVLAIEVRLNAALALIDDANNQHITSYNASLTTLQAEAVVLRSTITSLKNGGFVAK